LTFLQLKNKKNSLDWYAFYPDDRRHILKELKEEKLMRRYNLYEELDEIYAREAALAEVYGDCVEKKSKKRKSSKKTYSASQLDEMMYYGDYYDY